MTLVMAHDVCTLLDDSIVDDHRSPVGVALALHVGFGFGEILAASRVRVCVCLLSVASVRGFPSSCLTFDAAGCLSAGCAVDGYRMK